MIKTGERNNRGIPCCMGILWLLGILLPDRQIFHFTVIKNPTVKGLISCG